MGPEPWPREEHLVGDAHAWIAPPAAIDAATPCREASRSRNKARVTRAQTATNSGEVATPG